MNRAGENVLALAFSLATVAGCYRFDNAGMDRVGERCRG